MRRMTESTTDPATAKTADGKATDWKTTRVALKWCCRTSHDRWRAVGDAVLARGSEQAHDLGAGKATIEVHRNRTHRERMSRCLAEDPIRFWDLVYKYWRARGPHDGASREEIDLDEFRGELERREAGDRSD